MRNNFTTAVQPQRTNEHSGIIAARILGVPYVGQNVQTINRNHLSVPSPMSAK